MLLLSWTSLWFLLCTICLAGPSSNHNSRYGLEMLQRRQKDRESTPSTIFDEPSAATATEVTPKDSATPAASASNSKKTSAATKTSAAPKTSAAKTTSASNNKQQSTKPTSLTPSPSRSTKSASSSSDPSSSVTSSSSSSSSASASNSLTSSLTSPLSSSNIPQPTSIFAPQPQTVNHISVGGIVAGVVLGFAVLIGTAWIAIAKWRENRRLRARSGDDEAKHEPTGVGSDGHCASSQDSLLAEGHPVLAPNGLRLQSPSPLPRTEGQSFVSPYHGSLTSQTPQNLLPAIHPVHVKDLPELPHAEHHFPTPLGSHPTITQMQSPYVAMSPAGPQQDGSVSAEPLPNTNVSSPVYASLSLSAHQHSPPLERSG